MRTVSSIIAASAGLLLLASCGASPPRWYETDDTHWTVRLIEPDAPELIVEATVHDRGPYRFVLDPNAPRSVIDDGVARQLGLYSNNQYVRVVNQNDVTVPRKLYEVLALDVGDLHVRNVTMLNAPAGSLHAAGRVVHGVLGSDLLSRTIIVRADRDAGLVHLALTGHAELPAQAVAVKGWLHVGSLYVPATLPNGRTVTLQVRMASSVSTLRDSVLADAGLPGFTGAATEVDSTGTAVRLQPGGVATVGLDGIQVEGVEFYRHVDKRERDDFAYDGILGADLLSRYHTVIDRDHETVWLAPRTGVTPRGDNSAKRRLISEHTAGPEAAGAR
jgi:hypothetical protein